MALKNSKRKKYPKKLTDLYNVFKSSMSAATQIERIGSGYGKNITTAPGKPSTVKSKVKKIMMLNK